MHTPAEMKRELVRRMNAKDLPGTMELIADDAIYFWSNGSAFFGKPAITEAMRANFDGIQNDTYETLDVTWLVDTPDVAVCVMPFKSAPPTVPLNTFAPPSVMVRVCPLAGVPAENVPIVFAAIPVVEPTRLVL